MLANLTRNDHLDETLAIYRDFYYSDYLLRSWSFGLKPLPLEPDRQPCSE